MGETSARKISHKTDAVMKLLTGSNLAVNPMLDHEFKQSVIEMRSTEKIHRQESPKENTVRENKIKLDGKRAAEYHGAAEICISSELITELLPQALRRFKCCECDKCFAEAMTDALDAVQPVTVKVKSESDVIKAEELKNKLRKDVLSTLVKIAISRRQLHNHISK